MPGTKHAFEDAELVPHGDQIEKCLIVRIPEPLTFANVGDLRHRVRRFERYGSNPAHPSLPRLRDEDRYLIFDVGGLTGIDACATQILTEIVEEYSSSGTQVMFARMRPTRVLQAFQRSGIVDMCGGMKFFVSSVEEALKLAGMNGD